MFVAGQLSIVWLRPDAVKCGLEVGGSQPIHGLGPTPPSDVAVVDQAIALDPPRKLLPSLSGEAPFHFDRVAPVVAEVEGIEGKSFLPQPLPPLVAAGHAGCRDRQKDRRSRWPRQVRLRVHTAPALLLCCLAGTMSARRQLLLQWVMSDD